MAAHTRQPSHQTRQEQESGRADAPNIVIHIFSKEPRDYFEDLKLCIEAKAFPEEAVDFLSIRGAEAIKILDRTASTNDSINSNTTTKKGRVCEIHGILENFLACETKRNGEKVSLEECKELRSNGGMFEYEADHDFEMVFQPIDLYLEHKTPGLAVFDMDSTLIQQEVIDELARTVGRYEEVAKVTEAAMRGELDFSESLRARVAKLKGVHVSIWETLKKDVITITPGARELTKVLKGLGWKMAVLSGGFTPLANWLKDELGLDYAFANHLAMDEEGTHLSGELVPGTRIVDGTAKRDILVKLAEENGIALKNCIAVGDGSNDLLMMNEAGLGIAFNAKEKVQEAAPARLNSSSLIDVAYLLGLDVNTVG